MILVNVVSHILSEIHFHPLGVMLFSARFPKSTKMGHRLKYV